MKLLLPLVTICLVPAALAYPVRGISDTPTLLTTREEIQIIEVRSPSLLDKINPLKSTPSTDEEVTKQGWRANFKAQHKFDKALAKQTSKETGGRVIVQWKKGAPETLELSTVARKEAQEYWENNADARKFHCAEISATHNKVQKRIETIVRYHDDDGSRFSGFVVRLNKYDN